MSQLVAVTLAAHLAVLSQEVQEILPTNKIRLAWLNYFRGEFISFPVTVAGNPRTSPGSAILTISVFSSAEVVESFTRPQHRMNTPRVACPSTKSVAPLG